MNEKLRMSELNEEKVTQDQAPLHLDRVYQINTK